jgi:hypothetical protein
MKNTDGSFTRGGWTEPSIPMNTTIERSLYVSCMCSNYNAQRLQEPHGLELPVGLVLWKRFNFDYHVSFTPEEVAEGKTYYNYEVRPLGASPSVEARPPLTPREPLIGRSSRSKLATTINRISTMIS